MPNFSTIMDCVVLGVADLMGQFGTFKDKRGGGGGGTHNVMNKILHCM